MFDSLHFASNHFASNHFIKAGTGRFLFLIDGISRLDKLAASSLSISQSLNNRGTARFTLIGIGKYKPAIGQEVIIEFSPCEGEPFKRHFGGHIKDISSENDFCGLTVFHKITCVDYNALLDRRLVANIYQKQSVKEIITLIHKEYLSGEGITLNNVMTENKTIEKAVFSYVKVSKAFNDIATATGLFWYIDYFKDLHFFLRSAQKTGVLLSPDCGTSQNSDDKFCAYLKTKTCNLGISSADISVDKRSDQLTNEQWIIGGNTETDRREEEFNGDGVRRTFSMRYLVSTPLLNSTGNIDPTALTVNGVPQSIGPRDIGTIFDWYFTKGERVITQKDAVAGLPLPIPSGSTIEFTYIGLYKVIKYQNDKSSITKFKDIENTSGRYQSVKQDISIESGDYAQQIVDGLIDRYSTVPVSVSFLSNILVLSVGDIISVKLNDHDIDSPDGFIVESISIQEVSGKLFKYKYKLSTTRNAEGWQEYFRKIEYFGTQLTINPNGELVVGEKSFEGILASQVFSFGLGIGTLQTQDKNYERMLCHTGRALCNYNFHGVPEVKRLNLV